MAAVRRVSRLQAAAQLPLRLPLRGLHGRGSRWLAPTATEQAIAEKLRAALATDRVVVDDTSGGCGAQYVVQVESDKFRGLSTLKQNRLVTQILKDEISAMHAIRIFTSVPAQADATPPASAPAPPASS